MTRPTLDYVLDRIEIDELGTRYATALDDNRFELLDSVFTPDARLSYAHVGREGSYPEIRAWLEFESRPRSRVWLHLLSNLRLSIDGDAAKAVTGFFFTAVDHSGSHRFAGGEYRDSLTRTPEGWRIAERIEVSLWRTGNLGDLTSPG